MIAIDRGVMSGEFRLPKFLVDDFLLQCFQSIKFHIIL